eukprot:7432632-Lingulodinium_polyedra.AAC.1
MIFSRASLQLPCSHRACVSVCRPSLEVLVQSCRELAARVLFTYWPARHRRGACAGSGAEKLRLGRA